MTRQANLDAAILDAAVVEPAQPPARMVLQSIARLEPVVRRHGGCVAELRAGRARAKFPSATGALHAAIEFQQEMAAVNRHAARDGAVEFCLGLHLGELGAASGPFVARQGGILVSAPLRKAVAGQVKASSALPVLGPSSGRSTPTK